MDYLQKFKEKCKVNDIFMDKVNFGIGSIGLKVGAFW